MKRWMVLLLGLVTLALMIGPIMVQSHSGRLHRAREVTQPLYKKSTEAWNTGLLGSRECIRYEHVGDTSLNFYIFRPDRYSSSPRPVVIYIHGGALQYGSAVITSKETPHNHLMVAVEQGIIRQGDDFVSVNYRLAPQYPWPNPLHDVKNAVTFLIDRAHELNIDPSDMAVMGDSAGGELSTFVGLTLRKGSSHTAAMRAVVDLFGPTNRHSYAVRWRRKYGLAPNPVYGVYTWDRVKRESAVSHVHVGAPPFLIIQGTRDRIVSPSQSALLKIRLQEDDVPVHEILVHHAGHELVAVDGPISPSIDQISRQILAFLTQEMARENEAS